MKTPVAILLLVVSLSLFSGCITDPVTGNTVMGMPMSDAEEIAEGLQYAPSFKSQYEGTYPDPELNAYLGEIVLGMAHRSHRPDLPWTFTVLNSSEVNAFALPGGTVCITRGLLHQLDSEAEFAAVMGHEVGHVCHRHSVQQAGQAAWVSAATAAASLGIAYVAPDYAEAGAALGAVGGQLLLLSYSRGDEMEADERGVEYSYGAGYDPREMVGVFELFKEMKGGEAPPVFFSTHPLDDARIDGIAREVGAEYPEIAATDGRGLVRTTPTWERLVTGRLREAQKVYDQYDEANVEFVEAVKNGDARALDSVLAKVKACERALPNHALLVSAVGVIENERGNKATAKRQFQRAAAMQTDLFEPQLYLSRYAFEAGDAAAAHGFASRAIELYPHHFGAQFIDGRALDQVGDVKGAAARYDAVLQLAPEDSAEHRFCSARLAEIRGTTTSGQ